MKTYVENKYGHYRSGEATIPKNASNRHYRQMLDEVAEGDATIVPYLGSEAHAAETVQNAAAVSREVDIALLREDTEVLQLLKAGPENIDTYIENQVTDLDSAKAVLKTLARAVAVVAHTVIN
jgi:hypothetical protein